MVAVVVLVHVGVAALWLGSMAYSLFVVQPKLARMVGSADVSRLEDAQRELAQGNRWPVVWLVGVLWASGIVLAFFHDGPWWPVVLKGVLLAVASGLFWWVSWRGWPRRVFALPEELPALQRRFRHIASTMFAVVGAAFALSVLTLH
jgi:Flp pilus assembly protein TadB